MATSKKNSSGARNEQPDNQIGFKQVSQTYLEEETKQNEKMIAHLSELQKFTVYIMTS